MRSAHAALAFGLGAIVGSFLNVCIHRLPRGESIVRPGSHCPFCGNSIPARDNIPILSYLALRGRCRSCAARISTRYPLVEALTGLLAVGILWRYGWQPVAPLHFAFAAALVVITFIDVDHQIIPDAISLPGIGVGMTASFLVPGTPTPFDAAVGVLLGGGILYGVAIAYQRWTGIEGMGLGDVKLLAMIGAFLGWRGVPLCLLIASLTGSLVGLAIAVGLRKGRRYPIPFGPFLSAGAIATVLFGDPLLRWYLGALSGK